jgi:hypothetical protein
MMPAEDDLADLYAAHMRLVLYSEQQRHFNEWSISEFHAQSTELT